MTSLKTRKLEMMYYFVCTRCDAKSFAYKNKRECPRCGTRLTSDEQQDPPWKHYDATAIHSKDRAGGSER